MLPPSPKDIPQLYARALDLRKRGDLSGAAALLRRILLARPDTPEALFQLGRIEAASGRSPEAETHLRAALRLKPKEPAIWQALHVSISPAARRKLEKEARRAGIPLGTKAETDPVLARIARAPAEAEAQALALVKTAPEAFWPAVALARARLAQGKWGGALGPLETAHRRNPDHTGVQVDLARCLLELGHPVRAEALLTPLARSDPQAGLTLARLLREGLRPDEALNVLAKVQAPKLIRAKAQLEQALGHAALADGAAASTALTAAQRAGADPVASTHMVLSALQDAGASRAADDLIDRAIADHPGTPSLLVRRAQMHQSAGSFASADADLHAAIAMDGGMAEAYRAWMAARKVAAEDPVLPLLEAQMKRTDMPKASRRVLNFAAAKAYWDLGRMQAAFDALHRANRLFAEAFPYSYDADLAEARALVADWDHLAPLAPGGPDDPVLFVTGLPRSGTTLVETILAAHAAVDAGGEMPFLAQALSPVLEGVRQGKPDPALIARAGSLYLTAARRRVGGTLVADKAISTFSRIGHAARALPGARFVVLRRDPRDVGLSMYRNMFPEGLHRYTNDLTAMGRYIRLHDALIAFWAETVPDRVHIVDYETLTRDPEPTIRALLAFCGLDWDPACLHPEASERRIETLSFAQARAPIGQGSVALWERHADQLAPLLTALDGPLPILTGG